MARAPQQIFLAGLTAALLAAACSPAPAVPDRTHAWPDELRIQGAVLVAHQDELSEAVLARFHQLAGGDEARIGIEEGAARGSRATAFVEELTASGVEIVHAPAATEGLTALWLAAPPSSSHSPLRAVIDAGGVVLVPAPERPSAGIVPGALLEALGESDGPDRAALPPRTFGVTLGPGTVLELNGRRLRALAGEAHLFVGSANGRASREVTLEAGRPGRANLADLTAWRREAIERTLPPFPPAHPPIPFVPRGTLVIVGGGGMPSPIMETFVEAAGGSEARLVFVPASEADEVGSEPGLVGRWRDMGVASATWIHTKDRERADTDEAFLAPLLDATGIWFGGGRQWNFSDSYYGTTAHRLMLEVLERGGAIGGSSAGASIQAAHMARGDPLGNQNIIAPGYERGLGFIRGVSVDQHFSERNRQADMEELIATYPALLGIGVDEATALVVRQGFGEVIGRSEVHFYDRRQDPEATPVRLGSGGVYDLVRRRIVILPPE